MNIREHAKPRYVQRVMGMSDHEVANKYAQKNNKVVSEKILEFFNDSEILHRHYAPTRKESMSYYINGDFMIIVKDKTNEIDTMYRITLLPDPEENKMLIQKYKYKIQSNLAKVQEIEEVKHIQDKESKRLEEELYNSEDEKLRKQFLESIEKCKQYAAEQKELRMENRELMTRLFRKIHEQQEVEI
jgi:hypothetical protein